MFTIVIRVDSSGQIGSGHLMRCLTLAERMKKKYGANVHFICRDLPGNIAWLVEEQGDSLHMLPLVAVEKNLTGYASWLTVKQERDAEETIDTIKQFGKADLLVVDSYAIDSVWESMLRPYADEIFVIDDLANRRHDCDILLDQNFYLDRESRYHDLVPKYCRLLLGPAYALLRREFYEARKTLHRRDGNLHRILIFYGGSDLTNETSKAIKAIRELNLANVEVDVIVGECHGYREKIRDICESVSCLHFYCQVNNMAEFMAKADLCLGAGGTTTWERCYLGLPTIVTAVAENQMKICEDCERAGFIHYLGRWNQVTEEDICRELKVLKKPENLRAFQEKCLQHMADIGMWNNVPQNDPYLRLATEQDADLLFRWVNDPNVRQNSFHTEPISLGEHRRWLSQIFAAKNARLYILQANDKAIGQVRLVFADNWRISYSIASEYRRQGFGKIILQLAENELIKAGYAGEKMLAEVKSDNVVSRRIFRGLGYRETQSHHDGAYDYTKKICIT